MFTTYGMSENRTLTAVLDTNVPVSGLNFPGNEREVMKLGRQGRIDVCVSQFIINELILVLERLGTKNPRHMTFACRPQPRKPLA